MDQLSMAVREGDWEGVRSWRKQYATSQPRSDLQVLLRSAMDCSGDPGTVAKVISQLLKGKVLNVDDVVDGRGNTLSHLAAATANDHLLRVVLAHGANVTKANNAGKTAHEMLLGDIGLADIVDNRDQLTMPSSPRMEQKIDPGSSWVGHCTWILAQTVPALSAVAIGGREGGTGHSSDGDSPLLEAQVERGDAGETGRRSELLVQLLAMFPNVDCMLREGATILGKRYLVRQDARMKQPHAILIPKDDAPWDGVDCDADAAGGPRAEMFCFVTERLVVVGIGPFAKSAVPGMLWYQSYLEEMGW